jgi:hypothetical protein
MKNAEVHELPTLYRKTEHDDIEGYYMFVHDNGDCATLVTLSNVPHRIPRKRETRETFTLDKNSIAQDKRPLIEQVLEEARNRWLQKKKEGYTPSYESVEVRYFCKHGKRIKRHSNGCSRCISEALAAEEFSNQRARDEHKCPDCESPLKRIKGAWRCMAFPPCSFIVTD